MTDDTIPESVRESVMAELRKTFRPEFLNRIDDVVLFKPLSLEEIFIYELGGEHYEVKDIIL